MFGGLYFGELYLGGITPSAGVYTPPTGPGESKTFSKLAGFDQGKPTLSGFDRQKDTLSSIVSNKPTGLIEFN